MAIPGSRSLLRGSEKETDLIKSNAELQRDVLDELLWDPSISAANVEVATDHGAVTLSGSIASYTEKWAAKRAARRVRGVTSVVDNLEVRLPPARERTDADLAGTASDSMRWNSLVPDDLITVSVAKGRVTLTGEVPHQFQRDAAENAVRFLVGVNSVNNQIAITPPAISIQVNDLIEKALIRNAETDASKIHVDADGGKVTVSGTVHSWAECDAVIRAAWSAPGVHEVHDDLIIGA
jgi:osmotically-inducible protein OsmY